MYKWGEETNLPSRRLLNNLRGYSTCKEGEQNSPLFRLWTTHKDFHPEGTIWKGKKKGITL